MTAAVLLGVGLGAGLWLVVHGLWPPRPSLAEALAVLDRGPVRAPVAGPSSSEPEVRGALAQIGRPLARVAVGTRGSLVPAAVVRDLRVIDQSPATYVAEVLGLALVLPFLTVAVVGALNASGTGIPATVTVPLLLAAAGLSWPLVATGLHQRAAARRAEFRFALSGFVDLIHSGVCAGKTVDEALVQAAEASDSWSFTLLRQALASARARREASWTALAQLGSELSVTELEELAASVDLANRRGGQVLRTLAARADTLRSQRLADARAAAHRNNQLVSLPLGLMGAGFLLFILYPALSLTLSQ